MPGGLALLVALIATLLLVPRLAHRQIIGSHEAVFPIVARDIVERGAWMDAQLRGLPYRNKPPLYPWSIAALSWPTGRVTEITARIPVVLAAIGAVVVTFLLGARLFGRRAGLWAALILVTSVIFFDQALATIPDVPMLFFHLLAGLALWSLMDGGGRRALFVFYVALALGVFTKGIPGLLPLAVAVVWLGIDGGRVALRRLVWAPGLIIFAVATAVWLVPYLTTGHDVASDPAVRDWVGAVGVTRPRALALQALYAALGFLPWTPVLPLALLAAFRARRSRPVAFALCWFLIQVVVIFAMQQQRLRYLLPMLPGAALLVAWWADREVSAPRARPGLAALALFAGLGGVVLGLLALDRFDIALLAPRWGIGLLLAGILTLGAGAAAALLAGRLSSIVPGVAALSAILLFAGGWAVDSWENRTWDFRRAALDLARTPPPLAVAALADDHELLQVDFYLGRSLLPLRSGEAVARHLTNAGGVVVEASRWRAASEWLPLDPRGLRAELVLPGVFVVSHARR
jgi:4-amino-4-deoxy-L-arabinose transferase-like glycosyltransferase